MMPVPGIEPGLPTMSLLKYIYEKKWDLNSGSCIRVEDFATGPSEIDINISTKLYLAKSLVKEQTLVVLNGTNIFLVGLYFNFLNFICGIWS